MAGTRDCGAVVSTMTATRISLELGCEKDCDEFAGPLLLQLSKGYEECAVLPAPPSVEAWRDDHRTARKRSDRATRLGYSFREIAREEHNDDITAINVSKDARQGRPMSPSYREPVNYGPLGEYACPLHAVRTYGVLDARGTLVAYTWLYRSGELALISQWLGHGEHEANDVMYLLFQGAVERQAELGGFFVYNRWDSGTEGLRYLKERLGFGPMEVEWAL